MYKLLSSLSFLIRAYLCYLTIEQIPIIKNPILEYLVGEIISLYTVLWAFSYFTNRIIIDRLNIKSSYGRCFLYFIIYIIYIGISYTILTLLTGVGFLPIDG